MQLSEQEQVRREHLAQIRAMGIDPFPAAEYGVTHTAEAVREQFDETLLEQYKTETVCLAGRIMMVRDMGKAAFVSLQDSTGRMQLYVSRDEICTAENTDRKSVV